MDLVLSDEVDENEIIEKLNSKSASGIKFIQARKIVNVEGEKKAPQAMALIDACRYIIKISYENTSNLEKEIENLLKDNDWTTIKKSKKGEKEVNIRPLVFEFKYWINDNELVLNVILASGSREHLSADLLVDYIKERTSNVNEDAFVDIKREEMYFTRNEKLIPLCNFR